MDDHVHDSDVARPSCMMRAGHAMAGEAGGGETFHCVPHFQFWTLSTAPMLSARRCAKTSRLLRHGVFLPQDSDVEVVMETNPALLEAHLACLQDTKAKRLEELFKWRRCAEESW